MTTLTEDLIVSVKIALDAALEVTRHQDRLSLFEQVKNNPDLIREAADDIAIRYYVCCDRDERKRADKLAEYVIDNIDTLLFHGSAYDADEELVYIATKDYIDMPLDGFLFEFSLTKEQLNLIKQEVGVTVDGDRVYIRNEIAVFVDVGYIEHIPYLRSLISLAA